MTFKPGDKVTISNQTRIHVVDRESYMEGVVRTRCGRLGFGYTPHPMAVEHCRKCQEP